MFSEESKGGREFKGGTSAGAAERNHSSACECFLSFHRGQTLLPLMIIQMMVFNEENFMAGKEMN